jgi:antitoxin component of RelBE/YafQ-DinJ toxin-antitoxin module
MTLCCTPVCTGVADGSRLAGLAKELLIKLVKRFDGYNSGSSQCFPPPRVTRSVQGLKTSHKLPISSATILTNLISIAIGKLAKPCSGRLFVLSLLNGLTQEGFDMGTYSDSIVAARIPEEIREQVNVILAQQGFTPTQLINSAYRYFLEFQKLPYESSLPKPGARNLEKQRIQQIANELADLQVCTYDYSLGGTRTIKDALSEKLLEGYEALS